MNSTPSAPDLIRASYNITDDRLKAWFSDRVSDELYGKLRAAGFVYWRGSACFTCVCRPNAEDLLTSLGFVIEEDDTPEDTEARVERFAARAASAEAAAESAIAYLDSERANTERRRASAIGHAQEAAEKAEHYHRRILASIRRAQKKERPGSIARRIATLETQQRIHAYDAAPPSTDPADRCDNGDGTFSILVRHGSRHCFWLRESQFKDAQATAQRWVDHYEDRLTYERALLAAAGGIQAEIAVPGGHSVFEKGGAVQCNLRAGAWFEITRVNRVSIEVYDPYCNWRKFWKIGFSQVSATATAADVKAGKVSVVRAPKPEKAPRTPKLARDGAPLVAMGAAGIDPYFGKDPAKFNWCLIAKVNPSTVQIVWLSDGRLMGRKHPTGAVCGAKTPDEAKAIMPELVEKWSAYQDRVAAKKAKKKSEAAAEEVAA